MNKTSKVKCLLLPLVIASAGVFVGCTNSDYDFNEIDVTLGLGGNELLIPTSTTKEIALDDILKINEGDCVKILENGDYVFTQEGSDVEPAHPFIEKVTLVQASEPVSFDFNLDTYLNPAAARNRARASVPIGAEAEIVKFEYSADQPEILSITSANVEATMTLTTHFSENLAKCVTSFNELKWILPQSMRIASATASSGNLEDSYKGTNVLRLKNVSPKTDVVITIKVNTLDFSDPNNKELVINNGKLDLNGIIMLGIDEVEINPEMVQYLNDCYLRSQLEFSEIPITHAVGEFDPKIELSDLGNVDVTGVPDFLKEETVVVDLANPQILIEIDNEMDAAAKIGSATLTAVKDGNNTNVDIPTLIIHPEQVTKICICRDENKVDVTYADYDKYVVPNLSNIISTIPDQIKFAVSNVKVDNSKKDASFDLGREYTIKPSYNIIAPIAFGENANIVYTDSIDGIHGDIDGVELAKDAYIEVTANVENKLPVFLSTKVTPFDVNGNDLSQSVKVTIVDNIPAAKEGETAHGTIKINVNGDIKQLDKLKFRIGGSASKEGENPVTGITLNKNKHSLKLDNVKAKLVGKVIYDAN